MALKLLKRGNVWYVRGTVGAGKRKFSVYESAGTGERARAEAYRARREGDLWDAAIHGPRAVASFAEAALAYMQRTRPSRGDAKRIGRLVEWFGSARLAEVNAQEAATRAAERLCGPEASTSTRIRAVYTPLIAIINDASFQGLCDRARIRKPATDEQPRLRWLPPGEAVGLVDAAAPHLRPLIWFLAGSGARAGEAFALDWRDVDLMAGTCILRETKNGRDRVVYLPQPAIVALANLPHRRGPVFRRHDGREFAARVEQAGQVKRSWATACRRAGLAGVTLHTLRHSWATWMMAATRDPLRVMQEGGWRSLRMVERYAHLMRQDQVPELAKVWGVTHPDLFPARVAARAPAVQVIGAA